MTDTAKQPGMPDVTPEELARLRERAPIADDDPTAICTREGWRRYRARAKKALAYRRPDAPTGRVFSASVVLDGWLGVLRVRAERWHDARELTRRMFPGRDVTVVPSSEAEAEVSVRSVGRGGDANEPVRLEALFARPKKGQPRGWTPLDAVPQAPALTHRYAPPKPKPKIVAEKELVVIIGIPGLEASKL